MKQQHIYKKENQPCWGFYQIRVMRKEIIHTVIQINSPSRAEGIGSNRSSLDFYGEDLYKNKREKYILA